MDRGGTTAEGKVDHKGDLAGTLHTTQQEEGRNGPRTLCPLRRRRWSRSHAPLLFSPPSLPLVHLPLHPLWFSFLLLLLLPRLLPACAGGSLRPDAASSMLSSSSSSIIRMAMGCSAAPSSLSASLSLTPSTSASIDTDDEDSAPGRPDEREDAGNDGREAREDGVAAADNPLGAPWNGCCCREGG